MLDDPMLMLELAAAKREEQDRAYEEKTRRLRAVWERKAWHAEYHGGRFEDCPAPTCSGEVPAWLDGGGHAPCHGRQSERLLDAVPGCMARSSGDGLSAPRDVHAARGGRIVAARCRVQTRGRGRWRVVVRPESAARRQAPAPDEAQVGARDMNRSILDASVQLAGLFVLGVAGLVTLGIAWAVVERRRRIDFDPFAEPWGM